MRTIWPEGFFNLDNLNFGNYANAEQKKMIDKVTKLFALAESTSHTEEAETARRMAVELMAKHNIYLSDQSDDQIIKITEKRDPGKSAWNVPLLNSIARFNGCFMVTNKRKDHCYYTGTRSALAGFSYMASCIFAQRDREWEIYNKQSFSFKWEKETRSSWMHGFAKGVNHKIHELMKARDTKIQEWGLVPVNSRKQAESWYHSNVGPTARGAMSQASYGMAGYASGQSVNFNHGVGSQSSIKRISH